jgi:TPR repeat protein
MGEHMTSKWLVHLVWDWTRKLIEAVRQWKFEPARKDGIPVAVQINVEVSFRLYPYLATNPEIAQLSQKAVAGDLEATTKLGLAYLNGDGTADDSARGLKLLEYAARHGSSHPQFELAQYIVKSPPDKGVSDYVSAYSWYGIAMRGGHKVKDKIFRDLESKMTPDQLTTARSRIEAWPNSPAK